MKRLAIWAVMLFAALAVSAQSASIFTPYKSTELRLPAVPLVVNDPYFSIWSPFDNLTDGSTRLWTNDEKPLEGLLRVDGTTYRFMGAKEHKILEPIAPMAVEGSWEADYLIGNAAKGWQNVQFDTKSWKYGHGAFGNDGEGVHTSWTTEHSDIYIRRVVNITEDDLKENLYLMFSHDDSCDVWVNGVLAATGRMDAVHNESIHITGSLRQQLHVGKNVIAMHVHNNFGGALADFGLYRDKTTINDNILTAKQTKVDVMATSSYYTFECGPVELKVVFTAPMLINDLDLLSTPVNFISYQVKSTDGKAHDVKFFLQASPMIATNKSSQPTESSLVQQRGISYLKTGTIDQPILANKGDLIGIDWGYLYLPNINGDVCLNSYDKVKNSFVLTGKLPKSENLIRSYKSSTMPTLAYVHDFGKVTAPQASFELIGYDEVQDIEYMYNRYKAYWAHEGKVTIFDAFEKLKDNYESIMNRCKEMDKTIYDDGLKAGNVHYAEMLSASYRQVIAAHKIFKDNKGNLMFFSKENNSNGCVNTVDLTYPSAPLFLVYNPELEKGMMTSIFEYSRSGRWTKPFAAHDLGTYPIANGQVYGGDMPIEEAGNMITLAAMLSMIDGNTDYVNKYWDIITTWADYLVKNGQDPSNQLCTDDFAGHWAHNANLSVKAIMGVAGYAEMARMKGDDATADKYMQKAKEMGAIWEKTARESNHYRLAFDRENTWSQKYNMVWDKLWNTNVFPKGTMEREMKSYLKLQNKYGLPLDCRKDYTKSDWIMWTAAMAKDKKTFNLFMEPVYTYINETQSRVPISDWSDTKTGLQTGFKARSVIGGYWMKVFADKVAARSLKK